jgi:hypothetical protein
MKYLVIILIGLALVSCDAGKIKEKERETFSETGKLLKGEHLLRKFKVKTTTEERWSGSYFLIGGSAGGGTFTDTEVSFSFQLPDSTYAMATLPYQSIRVKLDSNIVEPFVTFRWDKSGNANIAYMMYYDVQYMVVHCKEEDFPMDVQINQL